MSSNKKGIHRERNRKDPAKNVKTVKLRDSHKEFFEELYPDPNRRNFSGFVGELMEGFLRATVLDKFISGLVDTQKLGAFDMITIIGNGIDGSDAGKCLEMWLDGGKIPEIKIDEPKLGLYKTITNSIEGTPGKELLFKESIKVLDFIREYYFEEKSSHLETYKVLKTLAANNTIPLTERKYFVTRVNGLIRIEYYTLYAFAKFSPQIRFATYFCHQNYILRQRALRPDWTAFIKDELMAMNQPWVDPSTAHIPEPPPDDTPDY